jgi:hypothetical protein
MLEEQAIKRLNAFREDPVRQMDLKLTIYILVVIIS